MEEPEGVEEDLFKELRRKGIRPPANLPTVDTQQMLQSKEILDAIDQIKAKAERVKKL